MINRYLHQKAYTFITDQVEVYAAVNVGAAGAVTLQRWNYPQTGGTSGGSTRTYTAAPTTGGAASFPLQAAQGSQGVFSVARTGAGLWTVTFEDLYQRMVGLSGYASLAGGTSAIVAVHENTTITNLNSGTPGRSIVGVALLSATASALDPASGERINLRFTFESGTTP